MRKLFTDAVWLQICTILSGSRNGNGRRSTAFMTLKIAVFAPIPSASVSTATAVKPGFFSSWRKANLRSFITQCLHRIDTRSASRRQPRSEQRHQQEQQRHASERQRIGGFDVEEQRLQHARKGQRGCQPDTDSQQPEPHPLTNYQAQHVAPLRAE